MINKQSNVYTIVYITVLVIVVGAALAFTSMSLKDRQNENAQADKKSQILQSVHISTTRATVIADFEKYITKQLVVNTKGEEISGVEAFGIDVAAEAKKPADQRQLPVYVCQLPDAGTKYILPLAGMGRWGPTGRDSGSRSRNHKARFHRPVPRAPTLQERQLLSH